MSIRYLRDFKDCPFVPGTGEAPPYFAGREDEQRIALGLLDRIRDGRSPGSDLILYGPRGTGKTVMLARIETEGEKREIEAIALTASEIRCNEALVQHLRPPPKLLERFGEISLKNVRWKSSKREEHHVARILDRRLRRGPVLLLVDEAHVLDIAVGGVLLPVVQKLRQGGAPLLLVLAGTPILSHRLRAMQASFWERSRILPFHELDERASSDAIRIPLQNGGDSITADALAQVVTESHGYPFFLQLWGEALWNLGQVCPTRFALSEVDRARRVFEERRDRFYEFRMEELEERSLVPVAAAVSAAFAKSGQLTRADVTRAIEEALTQEGRPTSEEAVAAARDGLHDLGYIWSPGGSRGRSYRPGIPSLMQYVAECAAQAR